MNKKNKIMNKYKPQKVPLNHLIRFIKAFHVKYVVVNKNMKMNKSKI